MSSNEVSLTIEGKSGTEFVVRRRGQQDVEEGDPSPIIWEGEIDDSGRATRSVPRAYLVIQSGGRTLPLPLHEEKGITEKTVQV